MAAAAARAAWVAAAAERLGQGEWHRDAVRLAGATPVPVLEAVPTYRELALAGIDVVEQLAGAGRWPEAAEQARHLRRYFSAPGGVMHQVAGESFDGLHAAVRARDAEELEDFIALLRELFTSSPRRR